MLALRFTRGGPSKLHAAKAPAWLERLRGEATLHVGAWSVMKIDGVAACLCDGRVSSPSLHSAVLNFLTHRSAAQPQEMIRITSSWIMDVVEGTANAKAGIGLWPEGSVCFEGVRPTRCESDPSIS